MDIKPAIFDSKEVKEMPLEDGTHLIGAFQAGIDMAYKIRASNVRAREAKWMADAKILADAQDAEYVKAQELKDRQLERQLRDGTAQVTRDEKNAKDVEVADLAKVRYQKTLEKCYSKVKHENGIRDVFMFVLLSDGT
jgi:hypothetical protein